MDSVGTNRFPLRSVAAAAAPARRSSSLRPPPRAALANRVAASQSGIASGCGGACFGKVPRFDSVRSATARAQSGNAGRSITEERERTMPDTEMPLKYSSGKAFPLGVSQVEGGLNLAIFSQHASSVTLCLKLSDRGAQHGKDVEIVEFALDHQKNKTGDIWHVSVEGKWFWYSKGKRKRVRKGRRVRR